MFDPSTVAFEIKYPWRGRKSEFFPNGYRETFIIVWHKDPCSNGSDDSCDWSGNKRPLNSQEESLLQAIYGMEPILDNRPFYPDHPAHIRFQEVQKAMWEWRERKGFRWHPRWHVWHWRIQIIPLQALIRFLFERCCVCKKGYKWKEEVIGNWDGDTTWHFKCNKTLYVPERP